MIDLTVFSIGLSVGAAILFLLKYIPEWRKYVAFSFCPTPAQCPHHREQWKQRITIANDNDRRGPTRPDIH